MSEPSNIGVLASLAGAMDEIQATKAVSSQLPPAGDYKLHVKGMSVNDAEIKCGDVTLPGLRVGFQFEPLPGAPGLVDTEPFWGKSFELVDPSVLSQQPDTKADGGKNGKKVALRMEHERFKGHLQAISGTPITPANFIQVFNQVKTLIASPAAIVVSAKITERPNNSGGDPWRTEVLGKRVDR